MSADTRPKVVVFVQENHTLDSYFVSLHSWGANVATGWPTGVNPPKSDQPHDRASYFKWLQGHQGGKPYGRHVQYNTDALLPFYSYVAKTGAFFENHGSAFGTNSTPNHLALVGGQSMTLRNPPRGAPPPVWDLPSVPALAAKNGMTWKGYTGSTGYPLQFYKDLQGSANIVRSDTFINDAQGGALPDLSMVWHDSPYDEHPKANITLGHNKIWQYVDAAVKGGEWDNTVFLLTWDDWGGFDDQVVLPCSEYTPDNVPVSPGPRIGLIMFGGHVRGGIDSRICTHVAIPKTVIQLLGLPGLGVPRVDTDAGIADRYDTTVTMLVPPAFGTTVTQPMPPSPAPQPQPVPAPTFKPRPLDPVYLSDGSTVAAPNDATLPQQPNPPV
jgi:Phosphoesterase family